MEKIAIIGAGNIGSALLEGLLKSGEMDPSRITVTDLRADILEQLSARGFDTTVNNAEALAKADIIVLCVKPWGVAKILADLAPNLDPSRHILVSIAAGVSIQTIEKIVPNLPVMRAIPNTAMAVRASMTALVAAPLCKMEQIARVKAIFDHVGLTLLMGEEELNAATVLASCGTAFALRYIRAAMQGGVQIGVRADVARDMVAQTLLGAAQIVLENQSHPEVEIDKVTTPKGLTIQGLTEMEYYGFSRSVVKGILASFEAFK
ncbi:MAG: pyrroline-5-carboxylate reductase [Bacteroidales bacterium]